LGSTVKVDGNETDAYAFLSVINLSSHAANPAVSALTSYLRGKASSTPTLAPLAALLAQSPLPQIGLILTDRLINVPSEVVPPMYSMLLEEISWAIAESEPYTFTHYVILSKTYHEVHSTLSTDDDRPKKKPKASKSSTSDLFYFHPEDEVFERHALCAGSYAYSTPVDAGLSDSKRAFQEMGIRPQGHVVCIEAGKFQGAVKEVQTYLKPGE
jgi:protein BCP1